MTGKALHALFAATHSAHRVRYPKIARCLWQLRALTTPTNDVFFVGQFDALVTFGSKIRPLFKHADFYWPTGIGGRGASSLAASGSCRSRSRPENMPVPSWEVGAGAGVV